MSPIVQRAVAVLASLGFLLALCPVGAAQEVAFEDFKSGQNGWVQSFNGNTDGTGTVSSGGIGKAILTHQPSDFGYHSISLSKSLDLIFKPNSWAHFRFRNQETLIGADMYSEVVVDGHIVFQLGINGEQHWQDLVPGQQCVALTNDNEFKVSMPFAQGLPNGRNGDLSLRIPPAIIPYHFTDWTILSMKYEVGGGTRKFRVYFNGREVDYCDLIESGTYCSAPTIIDNSAVISMDPAGWANPQTGKNLVTTVLTMVIDGHLYNHDIAPRASHPNCHASACGAVPMSTVHAPLGLAAKTGWMLTYDAVHNFQTAPGAYDVGGLWGAIFSGNAQYDTAVLMGALPWDPSHWYWAYMPPSKKAFVQAQMNAGYVPGAKNYVFLMIANYGSAYGAGQHNYLTKSELQNSWVWAYMSSSEKNSIPDVKTAGMEWDYVILTNNSDSGALTQQIQTLVAEGRMGTAVAVRLSLLTWEQAEFSCPYMSCSEVLEIRNLPIVGNPGFCSSRSC